MLKNASNPKSISRGGRYLLLIGLGAAGLLLTIQESRLQIKMRYQIAEFESKAQEQQNSIDQEEAKRRAFLTPDRIRHAVEQLNISLNSDTELAAFRPEIPLPQTDQDSASEN